MLKEMLLLTALSLFLYSHGQVMIVRDIKSFGAKGDGHTNDQAAFERAAAFFNSRKGNGTLVIPRGTYIVGKQPVTNGRDGRFNWDGQDVLHFSKVRNLTIRGASGALLRYTPGLKFGSFDPGTGKPRQGNGYFVDTRYGASIGHCIFVDQSQNVTISGLELDGNQSAISLGGIYGDVGRQLPHYGIFIQNSNNITAQEINVHHFGLDGIAVANIKTNMPDRIRLLNCKFNYNARQGLSWVGGNDLTATNCQFNHSGKGKFSSAPAAGLDIEAEYGPISNGTFENCEFIDATGCCMVADGGNSRDVAFNNCTFWSSTSWSIWTTKPGFTFTRCKIYGPIVHGYDAPNDKDATKFIQCTIEDRAYNGQQPAGEFLIETNSRRRIRFEDCTITANYKKLFWIEAPAAWKQEEKFKFINCTITANSNKFSQGDYIAVLRGAYYRNTVFRFSKKYYLNTCCDAYNKDGGGNKIVNF